MMKNSLLLMVMVLCVNACGEISYKRGASARDVENAHKACRNLEESALSGCLEKQGWQIQKFEDSELFAEASVTDNRGNSPSTEAAKAGFFQPEPTQTSQENPTVAQTPTATSQATTSANNTPQASSKPAADSLQTYNPMQTYNINSWWKMGASSVALSTDQKDCGTLVGAAHTPDFKTQTFTRGFISCMHSKGWKALKAIR